MLRSLFIYLSQAVWMRRLVMGWKLARRVALRFVAGEQLDEAVRAVKALNLRGMVATMDQLGEHTDTPDKARQTAEDILQILDAIDAAGISANLSIKLTQIGLALDEDLCAENLTRILERAKKLNNFVRIDMEDSGCVEATLRIYRNMRQERGFDNVGIVIQSYLYRSDKDTAALLSDGSRIRMVKGAYKEPPEVAYPKKKDVDTAFDRLIDVMLDASRPEGAPAISADGKWPPITAVASHDEARINHAIAYAGEQGVPQEKVEIQMLYGIRRDLQEELVAAGYPVRIYVPYGTEWYPYFMRRLAERPANVWFFLSSLLRR